MVCWLAPIVCSQKDNQTWGQKYKGKKMKASPFKVVTTLLLLENILRPKIDPSWTPVRILFYVR